MKHPDLRWQRALIAMAMTALLAPLAPAEGQTYEVKKDKDHSRRVVVDVKSRVPQLWSVGETGHLGITMVELTPELRAHFGVAEDTGVMISAVEDDSPAARSGLRVGDILTAIDGESVDGGRSVVGMIGPHEEGDVVSLEVFRGGSHTRVSVTLEARERPQLWLNILGREGKKTWAFRSDAGENVFVLPGPDADSLHIRRESLDKVMRSLHDRLASPDFHNKMFEWRSNTGELEDRIKELEQRLKELAIKLEEIER